MKRFRIRSVRARERQFQVGVGFKKADYVVKADDDAFIRLDELERHLRVTPREYLKVLPWFMFSSTSSTTRSLNISISSAIRLAHFDLADSLKPVNVFVGVFSVDAAADRRNAIRLTFGKVHVLLDVEHDEVVEHFHLERDSLGPFRSRPADDKFPHDLADSLKPVNVFVGVFSVDAAADRRNAIRLT
jgi:hypothetical protein